MNGCCQYNTNKILCISQICGLKYLFSVDFSSEQMIVNTYVQTNKQKKYRLPVLSISGYFVQWMKHYLPVSVACI